MFLNYLAHNSILLGPPDSLTLAFLQQGFAVSTYFHYYWAGLLGNAEDTRVVKLLKGKEFGFNSYQQIVANLPKPRIY